MMELLRGSEYDPYNWEYFSDKPVGDATLIRRDGRIFLENDKPVTSLQFHLIHLLNMN
jgi:hypothetical protein